MTHGRVRGVLGSITAVMIAGLVVTGSAISGDQRYLFPVQIPYEAPARPGEVPDTAVRPNTEPLTPEGVKRAEALLPLLSGNQELWAMGEFVHLGAPVLPVLVKALKMPDPRLRYNAIETIGMIGDPSAAPALLESALEPQEMVRVRAHALRVAVRLSPLVTPKAIEVMAKDPHESIRKEAAFQGRYVRDKAVIPTLIGLIKDQERFVAITAVQSLLLLTRHETELHDWEISTQDDRIEWGQEWSEWWDENKETFQIPEPRKRRRPL